MASFASKRGLFILGVFIITWALLLFYPISFAAEALKNSDSGVFVLSLLNLLGLASLKEWELAEFAVYWAVALYIFPAFSLFMSADQMISERQRGGLRFLTLRCSRGCIFFGRFLGHMLIQLCLLLITLAITYLLLLINNPQYWLAGMYLLPLLLINLIVVTSPFVALMSLLSVLMNSVRMASFVSIVVLMFGSFIINYTSLHLPFLAVLNYWIPGIQVAQMVMLTPSAAMLGLWIPIMQTLGFLVLGYGIFKRQAI